MLLAPHMNQCITSETMDTRWLIDYSYAVGLYDNKQGIEEKRLGEESLYDLAEDVILPENSNNAIHKVDTIMVENSYDKLTALYDTPFDNTVSILVFV